MPALGGRVDGRTAVRYGGLASPPDDREQSIPPRSRYSVPLVRGPRLELPPHPSSPDPADVRAVRRWARETSASKLTAIDLFCGAGGLSLGLRDAGFKVLVGADSDGCALETHQHNIGGLSYEGDLSGTDRFLDQLTHWGIRSVDLVAGGVPCQPFSRAGRSKIRSLVVDGARSSEDGRSRLWRSFVRVVEELRPRAALFENVPGLAEWDGGTVLDGLCQSLEDLDYGVWPQLVAAFEHGVPQHRQRLLVVALRDRRAFRWPSPRRGRVPTVRDAIADLPPIAGGHRDERMPYGDQEVASELARRLRRSMRPADLDTIFDHISRAVRPDDAEAFAVMAPGDTYADLPPHLQRYRSDTFSDKYKRLEWDQPSRTITAHIAHDGYWYIHPDQDRTLSVREAARIQTFPDWFRFAGHPSTRYRQIGNAVPPLLAESIGRRLRQELSQRGRPPRPKSADGFRDALLNWHGSHARCLPWRGATEPWHVLLAELCLHRTRASQVARIYPQLLELASTPSDLIRHATSVRALLAPLGLRWRTDGLFRVARDLLDRWDGGVPARREELLQLPGVGDYVADAVLVFCRSRRSVLLDTNTARIARRLVGRPDMRAWEQRFALRSLAGASGPDSQFNYALLDLGGTVCHARNPLCAECPVNSLCASSRPEQTRRLSACHPAAGDRADASIERRASEGTVRFSVRSRPAAVGSALPASEAVRQGRHA